MLIEQIEAIPLRLPTRRAHHLSFVTVEAMDVVLVRATVAGVVGYGEAATFGGPYWGEESVESIAATVTHYLAPVLIGQDGANLNAVENRLARAVRGNAFARSAVSFAIADAVARARGLRLADHLGGAVVESLELAWTLASGDTGRDIEEGEAMLQARRHRHFKIKIGAQAPEQDARHLQALGRAFAGRASLRVDVNQGWDEATATRWLPVLADAGVTVAEQPVPGWNVAAMARLSQSCRLTIMADEGFCTPDQALAHVSACGAVALKPPKHGGIAGTRAVAAIARAAGQGLYGGTNIEGMAGALGCLHLYATLGHHAWGCELFGPLLHTENPATTSLDLRDFSLFLPSGPGIGTDFDPAALARLRLDKPTLQRPVS